MSCNVQSFEPHFEKVLDEITAIKPDIVAMQETFNGDERLDEYFRDWHTLRHGHYWVGSRYPVTWIADCEVTQFGGRTAGMIVEIETPGGPIVLCDIHQMTVRFGLKELNRNTLINGDGTDAGSEALQKPNGCWNRSTFEPPSKRLVRRSAR